jgi:hypothetical protein
MQVMLCMNMRMMHDCECEYECECDAWFMQLRACQAPDWENKSQLSRQEMKAL